MLKQNLPEELIWMIHLLRQQIRENTYKGERQCVENLLASEARFPEKNEAIIDARKLVRSCREERHDNGSLEAFLQEFTLSSAEGIAMLCLAEALLRIPDNGTSNKLITEKIQSGDWLSHIGHSESLFVNASTWGLMLTGSFLELSPDITQQTDNWIKKLTRRIGESMVRKSMLQAMRIMSNQYVMGRSIEEAITRSITGNFLSKRFSFDMLGESARTQKDADSNYNAYLQAITVIGEHNRAKNLHEANSVSIKLSALQPQYNYAHKEIVLAKLLPKLNTLVTKAKELDVGVSIDAEEFSRLELLMDLFEKLVRNSQLSGWNGLGFVLQGYLKTAPLIADWLIALAHDTNKQLMVRLVKGAYWDLEIKQAQQLGLKDYPVFTRKVNTDLCYQHCARKLLAETVFIYPQFATHNAQTIMLILSLSRKGDFELQRLHGMGDLLYKQLARKLRESMPPVRIYAPVGEHRELLPYLVRRLLENGANTSFVNQFLDLEIPIEELVQNISQQAASSTLMRHSGIPLPRDIYSAQSNKGSSSIISRINSAGIDLNNPNKLGPLLASIEKSINTPWLASSIVNGKMNPRDLLPVNSPAAPQQIIGHYSKATPEDLENAITIARSAQPSWDQFGGQERAKILERMADKLEQEMPLLVSLVVHEAGRTIADALSEIRESIDFCRYYGQLARMHFSSDALLPGPTGEENRLSLHGRGVFVCISPWNFPASIFTGQIAAALAAGNSVLAKPAELTPLVATQIIHLFHQSDVPNEILHLIVGNGSVVGEQLLKDSRIDGVAFTGSTQVAKHIQRQLTQRTDSIDPIVPLIAETGGQNVMIVDSTALPEQVVDDVINSAFFSAGQRCSSLRVLFLQQEVSESILDMLISALPEYIVGDPSNPATDIGPVISDEARQKLLTHIKKMKLEGKLLARGEMPHESQEGFFVPPHIFEIESLQQLPEEVFGPILHVIKYQCKDLDKVVEQINHSGYGLTLGIHSRIKSFADYIFTHTRVGNTYINRNMVGAVVGSNPFGGCGLSGTGPKAGGPYYLFRFATERTRTENITARGGNMPLFSLKE